MPNPAAPKSSDFDGVIDLLTQDYPSKSVDQNQAQLINMYLAPDQSKGKYSIIAYPTAGLISFCDTTQGSIRAMLEQNDVLYVVAGNTFYSINSAGVATSRGTLNTSSGFAKMAAITGGTNSNNQIVIIDGTNGYHFNIGTSTATFPIADVDFPQTAVDLVALDDYFILLGNDSISFSLSTLANGLTYAALDFSSKTRQPDKIKAIAQNQGKLYLLGSKTTEIYYNSGDVGFPFERVNDVFIHHGCAAKNSVATCGQFLTYLSKTPNGGYTVVQVQGYIPKPLGNPATDYQMAQMTSKSDAIGYGYIKDGHEFYDLTFPTDGRTFTYDLTTGIVLNRQSNISAVYTRFLGNNSAFCYDKALVGSYNSGVIYSQSTSTYTEGATAIRRMIVTPPVYMGGNRIFIRKLQIDVECNVGASKTFTLEKSNDSGRTWSSVATYTIGADNNTRLYTNGLGSARNWMFRITTTMNANFIVLGFIAQAEIGEH